MVACDDGIWPIFYAVVARERVEGVFTACLHLGRPPNLRRFYMFALGGDPGAATTWTRGAVYALPRAGFRREWEQEWVSPEPVRPVLRVPVGPEDFPLRDAAVGATPGRVPPHLPAPARREAKARRVVSARPSLRDESADDSSGKQELHVRGEAPRAMPAPAPVEQLPPRGAE